jgi:hypothetical protein
LLPIALWYVNRIVPDIVSVSTQYKSGKRINTEADYAALYHYIGSTDNADFARIARSRRVIFVEGRDGRLLRRLASQLKLERLSDPQGTAIVQLGGFSRWRRAQDTVWAFRQILDLEIEAFCLFDRDYRCDEEIERFSMSVSADEGVVCRVLRRKEIENYILVPVAINKALLRRIKQRDHKLKEPPEGWLLDKMQNLTEEFKVRVLSQQMAHTLQFYKEQGSSQDQSSIIGKFTARFEHDWQCLEQRLRHIPGKEALARLNDILQSEFGISLTETMIVEQLSQDLLDPEFSELLKSLDQFCTE